jgi:pyruvate ferredoxin oxidoreductase alpha subunit
MAFKVCEDHDVRLPAVVNQDGFLTSHTAQGIRPLSDDDAYNFVGEYKPMNELLDFEHPVTHGVQTEEDWHFEHKARQHADTMNIVPGKIDEVFAEFEKLTGRKYSHVECYDTDDADIAVVCMGSTVETAREVAREMREKGIKAGVIGIRVFRPFPFEAISNAVKDIKAVAALDRSAPGGAAGALFNEIAGSLINTDSNTILSGYIYGLGGRDLTKKHLIDLFEELQANADAGKLLTKQQQFIGVRGPKLAFL